MGDVGSARYKCVDLVHGFHVFKGFMYQGKYMYMSEVSDGIILCPQHSSRAGNSQADVHKFTTHQ